MDISVHPTPLKTIYEFLFCVVYGILYLQAVHHISNNGVEYLLWFGSNIFQIVGTNVNNQLLFEFCIVFSPSLLLARKLLKLDRDDFKRYTVCSSCHNLYDICDCVVEKMVSGLENSVRQKLKCVVYLLSVTHL